MTVRQQQDSSILRGLGVVGFFLLNAAGSWIAYSRFAVNHNMPLPPPVDGERGDLDTPSGRVSYFADRSGVGRPVVLIHSINAAASSYEMKPLFDHYRGERPVYALDLPGFGLSERRDQRYTPQLYNDTIVAFLRDVVGEPADVVVLSLGSEFAAMAALQSPESIHTLTLLSPTGLGRTPAVGEGVYKVVSFPLWGRPLFDLLVIEPSLRFFLGKVFYGDVSEAYVEYAYLTGHQPGAHYAPLYFVAGQLFTPTVRTDVYEKLTMPTLIVYGDDPNVSFDKLPDLLRSNDNVSAVRLEQIRSLPHWDRLEATTDAINDLWNR